MALTLTSEYSISYLSPGESGWPDAVRKDKLIVCRGYIIAVVRLCDALTIFCSLCLYVYAFRGRLSNSGILTN